MYVNIYIYNLIYILFLQKPVIHEWNNYSYNTFQFHARFTQFFLKAPESRWTNVHPAEYRYLLGSHLAGHFPPERPYGMPHPLPENFTTGARSSCSSARKALSTRISRSSCNCMFLSTALVKCRRVWATLVDRKDVFSKSCDVVLHWTLGKGSLRVVVQGSILYKNLSLVMWLFLQDRFLWLKNTHFSLWVPTWCDNWGCYPSSILRSYHP